MNLKDKVIFTLMVLAAAFVAINFWMAVALIPNGVDNPFFAWLFKRTY